MNRDKLLELAKRQDSVTLSETEGLSALLKQHPYFVLPRVLHLKALRDQKSFSYNNELKVTAAHIADRRVLFEYITSDPDLQYATHATKEEKRRRIQDIAVHEPNVVVALPRMELAQAVAMQTDEAHSVLNPKLFLTKDEKTIPEPSVITERNTNPEPSTTEGEQEVSTNEKLPKQDIDPRTVLKLQTPLEFDRNELHSFSEWLRITPAVPIEREKNILYKTDLSLTEKVVQEETSTDKTEGTPTAKQKTQQIIDAFIQKNPKIGPITSTGTSNNLAKGVTSYPDALMTETLARVYIEQKNYKKAIQAYKILILKNPEKSGFFADQIRAVEKLRDSK